MGLKQITVPCVAALFQTLPWRLLINSRFNVSMHIIIIMVEPFGCSESKWQLLYIKRLWLITPPLPMLGYVWSNFETSLRTEINLFYGPAFLTLGMSLTMYYSCFNQQIAKSYVQGIPVPLIQMYLNNSFPGWHNFSEKKDYCLFNNVLLQLYLLTWNATTITHWELPIILLNYLLPCSCSKANSPACCYNWWLNMLYNWTCWGEQTGVCLIISP